MKIFKRWEEGFSLIELLIVVAILGILAAVVVPQMGRFLGSGKTESREAEIAEMRTAVNGALVDNGVSTITPTTDTTGCTIGTMDMTAFPDTTFTGGVTVFAPDTAGIVLWNHDLEGEKEDGVAGTIKYISKATSNYYYTVTSDGTIRQYNLAGVEDTNN